MKVKFLIIIILLVSLCKVAIAQKTSYSWGFSLVGTNALDKVNDFVLDSDNNTIVTGYYTGSGIDFDPGEGNKFLVGNNNSSDVFVAKYNKEGKLLWAFGFGSFGTDEGTSICTDKNGDVYVTGSYSGTIDIDPGDGIKNLFSFNEHYQTFVAKFSGKDGALIWAGNLADDYLNVPATITADLSGNIYLSGKFTGYIIDLDLSEKENRFNSAGGPASAFLAKYEGSSGNYIWGGILGGSNGSCEITSHAIDTDGSIHITGNMEQTVDFDINTSTYNNVYSNTGFFLAKYSSSGSLDWVNKFDYEGSASSNNVCVDKSGNITITGKISSTVAFGPNQSNFIIRPSDLGSIFLAQYSSKGECQWAFAIGNNAEGTRVKTSSSGIIYLVGNFENYINADPNEKNSIRLNSNNGDILMAKYSKDGKFIWAQNIGGNLKDDGTSLGVDGTGSFWIAGALDGSGNLDPAQIQQAYFSARGGDIFLAKYDSRIEPSFVFTQIPIKTYGDPPFKIEASVTSGLPLTYKSSDMTVGKINKDSVIITGAGTAALTAQVDGNENYYPGTSLEINFTVYKAQQELTFADIPAKTYGDAPFVPDAKSSAGLPITLYSEDQNIAKTSGNTITIMGAGYVTISAWCDGDKNYYPSNVVYKILNVNKANQVITFDPLADRTLGEPPFSLTATVSSGLPLQFESSNLDVASVSGGVITLTGIGNVSIIAHQEGNENYNPVTIERSLKVKGPILSISGRETVAENTLQAYSIVPQLSGHTYTWEYSDTNVMFPDKTGPTIAVGFNKNSENGNLRCVIFSPNGSPYDTVNFAVRINRGVTVILPTTSCPESSTFEPCSGGHIDYFSLGTLTNKSSGCNPTGYADYTQSDFVTKLFIGDVYKAEIHTSGYKLNAPTYYTALWIDYNNNGEFDDAGEFLTSSFGKDSIINLQNLPISSNTDFAGARRLRIRMRTSGAFTSAQGCISQGETGETEDYLIQLTTHDRLEAPSIITPNNDGKNDYFIIHGINDKEDSKLEIFDRFGKVWFTQTNYNNSWNGTGTDGDLLPIGTYYYVFANGNNLIKGFIEIKY